MEHPRTQPYVGPRPFERGERQIFSGRDAEANDLVSLLIAHSTSLIFGHAGTGKSSLVNAAVIPLLEEVEAVDVLPITRFREPPPKLEPPTHVNVYTFNTLSCWDEHRSEPRDLAQQSLGDYLAKLEGTSSDDNDSRRLRVAIFDQFEEIFSLYPAHWQDRRQFFAEIRDALERNRLLRVVFLMREDYIGELDPYVDILPDKLRTRFRLEHLNEHSALAALTAPLSVTDRNFGHGVAEQLIDDLRVIRIRSNDGWENVKGQYVDALQLQVVAQTLWESLEPEEMRIEKRHLEHFGNVETALTGFYESTIRSVTRRTEIKEGALRLWVENSLITQSGTRGIVYRGETTAGISNEVVDLLVTGHLLRGELRGGGVWYELVHDRFIQPIRDSNERWLRANDSDANTRQRLEKRAAAWVNAGRSAAGLLDESELLEAERWFASPATEEVGYSEQLLLLRSASQAALAKRTQQEENALAERYELRAAAKAQTLRRLRILTVVLGLLSLWAVIATVLWLR